MHRILSILIISCLCSTMAQAKTMQNRYCPAVDQIKNKVADPHSKTYDLVSQNAWGETFSSYSVHLGHLKQCSHRQCSSKFLTPTTLNKTLTHYKAKSNLLVCIYSMETQTGYEIMQPLYGKIAEVHEETKG